MIADALKEVETISDNWRECPQCGLISTLPVMRPELTADCPRCHHVLWRMRSCSFELPLACALAGALFFFYAVIAPFLEISSHGQFQMARIETGPYQLAAQGFDTVGLLVLGVSVILPGVKLLIILVDAHRIGNPFVAAGDPEGYIPVVCADHALGDGGCLSAGLSGGVFAAGRYRHRASGYGTLRAGGADGFNGGGERFSGYGGGLAGFGCRRGAARWCVWRH